MKEWRRFLEYKILYLHILDKRNFNLRLIKILRNGYNYIYIIYKFEKKSIYAILFQNLWEVEFPIIVRNERYLFIEMARRVAIKIFGREEIKSGLKVVTKSRDSSKIFDKLSRARYNFARVVRLLPIRGLNLCPSVSIRVVSRLAGARGG